MTTKWIYYSLKIVKYDVKGEGLKKCQYGDDRNAHFSQPNTMYLAKTASKFAYSMGIRGSVVHEFIGVDHVNSQWENR